MLIGIYYFLRRTLAWFGLKLDFGPSADQVRKVAGIIAPVASPTPLIRLGGDSDGAYLVPDDLSGIGGCFSPGVAESCSFELELAGRGIPSYMADFSVDYSPVDHPLLSFEKLFIGPKTDGAVYISLADWVASKAVQGKDLILQMDIEGSEWSVLESTPSSVLQQFRIIVIEFHDLDEMMSNVMKLTQVESVFQKLAADFEPVHLHANNCCPALRFRGVEIPRVLEVTLLRKTRFHPKGVRHDSQVPHPLDIQNMLDRRPAVLTADWTNRTDDARN
jgi:hypothetical protein